MLKRIDSRMAFVSILGALALGACTGVDGSIPPDVLNALPQDVELSVEDNSIEFTDVVLSISGGEWVVGAFTLGTNAETEIEPGIAEGDLVKVHAGLTGEGDFIAREISLANQDEAAASEDQDSAEEQEPSFVGEELEFVGTVEVMGEASWMVNGQVFLVTPETEIKDDIAMGDLVKVHAFQSETGELSAREIELTDESAVSSDDRDSDDDLKFVGVVESIDGETWVIGGQVFTVDTDTEIDDGIMVGDTVEVYLFLTPDGLTIVREISLDDDLSTGHDDMDDDDMEDEDGDDDRSGGSESDDSGDHESSEHESDD